MNLQQRTGLAAVSVTLAASGLLLAVTAPGSPPPRPVRPSVAVVTPSRPAVVIAPPTNPLTGAPGSAGKVLAVKIDNVQGSRPALGLAQADLVYVEQVEGGLSRLMAVYDTVSGIPPVAGPVRSARETDLTILDALPKVSLVYSGAVSRLYPTLDGDPHLVNIRTGSAFFDSYGLQRHLSPHDTYVHTAGLADGAAPAVSVGLTFGALRPGGIPSQGGHVNFPAARYRFTWNGSAYNVVMDGALSPWRPVNVVVQHVKVVDSPRGIFDTNAGYKETEPYSVTTGSGVATVYRDGVAFDVTWSKVSPEAPTSYLYEGSAVTFAPGQTWVVLAP